MLLLWITCAKLVDVATPVRDFCGQDGMLPQMGFANGTISACRFEVVGKKTAIDQELIERFAALLLQPEEHSTEELSYGWSGGRHVLDAQMSFEHNVFNDCVCCAMRVDVNRVPAELKRAYQMMEEEVLAAQNPSGFISKKQKKEAREAQTQRLEQDLRSGKFCRSKLTPVLWDAPGATIYSSASTTAAEKLQELFSRTTGLELEPMTSGTIAQAILEKAGRRRDYEDLRPTRFVFGPDGEGQFPEYPWSGKTAGGKDFLGNEFLLWLWHEADLREGVIRTDSGDATIFIDRQLDLDCAYGQSGRDSLRGTGPTRMPEARDALRTGKVPRKVGLLLDWASQNYSLTLSAENLAMSGLKLPEVQEADTPRTLFEERITLLRDLSAAIDAMFATFLKVRTSGGWDAHAHTIRKWIQQTAKPIASVALVG